MAPTQMSNVSDIYNTPELTPEFFRGSFSGTESAPFAGLAVCAGSFDGRETLKKVLVQRFGRASLFQGNWDSRTEFLNRERGHLFAKPRRLRALRCGGRFRQHAAKHASVDDVLNWELVTSSSYSSSWYCHIYYSIVVTALLLSFS